MPKSTNIAAAIVMASATFLPCLAQEYIVGPLPTVETSKSTLIEVNRPVATTGSTTIVEEKKGVQFEFKQRLSDIQDRINTGMDKGWLKVGQAAAFKTEHDRLLDMTNRVESEGWPKGEVDQLEKDVTSFSASVSTAMSSGTPAPTTTTTTIIQK